MSDAPVVHIGENSPEQVAYKLFHHIADVEGIAFHQSPGGSRKVATRDWILQTYAQCINAVTNPSYHLD